MVKVPEKWPYRPPDKYDLKPLSEHWRPAGYLLLSEAVDIVGRATFGEEWTGEELKARQLGKTVLEPPSELEDTIYTGLKAGVQMLPSSLESRGGWRVTTTEGNRIVDSEERASALWKQERPKLVKMCRAEEGARQRHDAIVQKLRTDLNAGTLHAWVHRTKVGGLVEIPPDDWGRDDIVSVFELGNRRTKWLNPNIIKFIAALGTNGNPKPVEGRVLLLASEVQTYVKQQDNDADASGPGTIAAETRCEQWIRELVSQGYIPESKEALWRQATQRWGARLSRRGFDRAWANASPDEWKRSGRKSKR